MTPARGQRPRLQDGCGGSCATSQSPLSTAIVGAVPYLANEACHWLQASDFRLPTLCSPRATLPAGGRQLSNGAHRGRRSSNSGSIFGRLPGGNYPHSYSSNDRADCDAPGPTSSRPMESGPVAHEETAVAAQARSRPLQQWFGSVAFSKLRSPQVRPRGFDQLDRGMTGTSQARSGQLPGKARRTAA